MNIYSTSIILALAGCSPSQSVSNRTARPDVGRFQFHEASEDLPALILDTTSGCLSHAVQSEKATKDSDWVELSTDFGKWQCPQMPDKDTK